MKGAPFKRTTKQRTIAIERTIKEIRELLADDFSKYERNNLVQKICTKNRIDKKLIDEIAKWQQNN